MKNLIIGIVVCSTILVLTIINFIHRLDCFDPINSLLTGCLIVYCVNDMITVIKNYIHQKKNDREE